MNNNVDNDAFMQSYEDRNVRFNERPIQGQIEEVLEHY
jgi:hypothetical protein